MNIQKNFLIILTVVLGLLIIASGVTYLILKKSDSVTNKERAEYTNYFVEKYNFSIDYPKDYFIQMSVLDPHIPPLENEQLLEINFRSHSVEETEKRYWGGLDTFPDDYKSINVKVYYKDNDYDFKFEPFQVKYNEDFDLVIEHMKNSIIRDTVLILDNSTESNNTRSYVDENNGFSIEYPNWEESEDINYRVKSTVFVNCLAAKIGGEAQCPFDVLVEPSTNIEDFVSEYLSQKNLRLKSEITNQKINGVETINFIAVSNDALELEQETTVFLSNEHYVLINNFRPDLDSINKNYATIISGFKFLDN